MIKAIIFDFDGVLVDSNKIKKEAFFQIFSKIQGSYEVIKTIEKDFENFTRNIVVERIINKLVEKKLLESVNIRKEINKYLEMYAKFTTNQIINSSAIKGAKEVLEEIHEKYPLFINSATPDGVLKIIISQRNMLGYFQDIYGATSGNKIKNTKKILKKFNLSPSEVIFIGDSESDLTCAIQNNIQFVGIINESNDFSKKNLDYKLNDLTKLSKIIKNLDKKFLP